MRKFDHEGLEIASFQAELFEASVTQTNTSSPIFLRRFLLSDFALIRWATPRWNYRLLLFRKLLRALIKNMDIVPMGKRNTVQRPCFG